MEAPKKSNLDEILAAIAEADHVVIIGGAAVGKTSLMEQVERKYPGRHFLHTDDFMKYGFEQALYVMMDQITTRKRDPIVEGIQGFRYLRKLQELSKPLPDLIIHVTCSNVEERIKRISKRKKDINKSLVFDKMLYKIYNDFLRSSKKPPLTLHYDTSSKAAK